MNGRRHRLLANHGRDKNLRRIHRVKTVLLPTEFAAHLDVIALGQNALDLVLAQAAQHVAHALAAALGDALLGAWDSVHAPEEIFFPTMLALLGHLRADAAAAEEEEEGDGATAEVFIHAKFPERVRSAWARARLIRGGAVCYRPAWNSVDVVRAMLALAHEARDCDQIVFATESCLPLYDLQTTARRLLAAPQKSWLRATRAPQSRWEAARCFDAVDPRVVPRSAVHKCLPGWISLTRTHAQEIGALAAALGDAPGESISLS